MDAREWHTGSCVRGGPRALALVSSNAQLRFAVRRALELATNNQGGKGDGW